MFCSLRLHRADAAKMICGLSKNGGRRYYERNGFLLRITARKRQRWFAPVTNG
jgi:hypothetical protein